MTDGRNIETRKSVKDVSAAFGLSYANYLVVPRSVLEMMPREWQVRFVAMIDDIEASIEGGLAGTYEVNLLKRDRELITVYEKCDECDDGVLNGEDCPHCDGMGELHDSPEHRYETADEVGRQFDNRADYRHPHHGLTFDQAAYEARQSSRATQEDGGENG